jgi:RNA-directed DNA polymerase
MTKPRYPTGCAARSQESGAASSPWAPSPADNAWIVNFNNGNSNDNDRNNHARVRAVRSASPAGECQGSIEVSFRSLFHAWRRARKRKVPSSNQMRFEARWADRLLDLEERIAAGSWSPSPSTCFIASAPKAREIHAPDFSDRVVHHWLVPQLEAAIDHTFIHDSHANRVGHGAHVAVDRLHAFVRQVDSGQGGGWYLQLDVANFFNAIHRPTLWRMLKRRMARAGIPIAAQRVSHALLRQSPLAAGVVHCSSPEERARVPAHKRLDKAAAGCGLPIGNLSSQFLANLYLDALDQFVKHKLRAKRYVRYVDDFVLVHESREQLQRWCVAIERFLRDELRLGLKADIRLRRLDDGIDFLGYVVFPRHRRVRPRVVDHARAALARWARGRVRDGIVHATPRSLERLRSLWSSYEGHFRHANTWRLREAFHARYPWLAATTRQRRARWYALDRPIQIGFRTRDHHA